jgi:hypothetical protein
MSRKQIWLNPPLERLAEQCGQAKGRDGKFSARLGDIVERYEAIMANTPIPAMTDEEKMILGAAVCGSVLSTITIKYLHEGISDLGIPGAIELAEKVQEWTAAERIAAIESLKV